MKVIKINIQNSFMNIKKKLLIEGFMSNVLTLMSGTVFGQILVVLVSPILTRLYSPEDFGTYSLYMSILGVLTVVSCLSYEMAIVLPEKDDDASNIFILSIIVCAFFTVLIFFVALLWSDEISLVFNSKKLSKWLIIMPISVFISGFFRILNYWSTRNKEFKRLAIRQITTNIVTSTTQIFLGLGLFSFSGGLILGSLVGQLVATVKLAVDIMKKEGKRIVSVTTKMRMILIAKRYRNFPFYSTFSSLINSISTMLPTFLLAIYFDSSVVGYYAISHRILSLPIALIGSNVAQVFLPKATSSYRDGTLSQTSLKMFKTLLGVGLVPIILVAMVAPELFSFVFGSKWRTAGIFARWISIWLLLVFISSPISVIYDVLEKQRNYLYVNIVMLSVRTAVLLIGGYKGDANLSIALFGIVGALLWIFNSFYILSLAGNKLLQILGVYIKELITSFPFLIIPLLIKILLGNEILYIFSALISGIVFILTKILEFSRNT